MMNELQSVGDFEVFAVDHEDAFASMSLPNYLDRLLEKKSMLKADVIKRAHIDRVYGYQIFRGSRFPSRDKVLLLGFGFSLAADEMQKLLKAAGYALLYPKIKRDAAVLYCLNKGYDLFNTQFMLQQAGLEPINE